MNQRNSENHRRFCETLILLARTLFFLMNSVLFVLILFFRDAMRDVWESEHKIPVLSQWLLLLTGLCVLAGAGMIWYKHRGMIGSWCSKYAGSIAGAGSVLLCLLQLFISYQIYFYPGWDAELLVGFAEHMESHTADEIMGDMSGYFSLAPNNILLTVWFRQLIHLSRQIGIFTENSSLMMLIFVQCLISSLAVYLVYQCVRKVTQSDTAAFAGWITAVFLWDYRHGWYFLIRMRPACYSLF